MKCESVAERITLLAAGTLPDDQRNACMNHIAGCAGCADALQGAVAMHTVRAQAVAAAPDGLFDRVMRQTTRALERRRRALQQRFWLGAGFGGAIAAALLAVAFALGMLTSPGLEEPGIAEFFVSTDETRSMDIAIEADRPLPGARISILLSGGVELEGFGERRELSWNEDLEAGLNKLSLPLTAVGENGGQMVVRLSHPDSEQLFVIQLKIDG